MAKETDKRVFVALINGADQVLIIKRSAFVNNPGTLGLAGGHMDEGETIEEGAQREVREELGVDIDFGSISYTKVHADKKRTILIAQMPPPNAYKFNIDHNEVECVYWMTVDEIAFSDEVFHRSLELALPILQELEPKAFNGAIARTTIHQLTEIA